MTTTDTHIEVAPDTSVTVYEADREDQYPWTVLGDLRAPGSGMSDNANYDVYDALKPAYPGVQFDSESSCFYAYAKSEADALSLVESIKEWMVTRGRVPNSAVVSGERIPDEIVDLWAAKELTEWNRVEVLLAREVQASRKVQS